MSINFWIVWKIIQKTLRFATERMLSFKQEITAFRQKVLYNGERTDMIEPASEGITPDEIHIRRKGARWRKRF